MEVWEAHLKEAYRCFDEKQYEKSVNHTTEVLRLNPNHSGAWVLRGGALVHLNSFYTAILNFDRAIMLNPQSWEGWNNRGLCYFRLAMFREAIADFEKSIEVNPDSHVSHFQLGLLYSTLEEPERSEYHLREADARCPEGGSNKNTVNIYLATLLQGLGNWKEGFERDKYRHNILEAQQKVIAPVWAGEDLTGKSILLYTEAGWGDKVLSLRYLNLIQERYKGVTVVVATSESLMDLVHTSFPHLKVVNGTDIPTDYAGSLADVPMNLNLTWDTVPRPEKYLTVNQEKSKKWKERLATLPMGLKIGFCWASFNGVSKTMQPWDTVEIGGVPFVHFISLQKPYRQAPKELKLHDWTGELADWSDTAALIDNLDLVISIDTGVAHVAGALGKPTWCIVRYSTFWPWMRYNIPPTPDYSIWYPSMILFRQNRFNDWLDPMRRVTLLLQKHLTKLT